MTVDANRVWSATLTLTGNGDATGAQRFKFDVFGNWAENYGDNEGMASPTRAATRISWSAGRAPTASPLSESDLRYTVTPHQQPGTGRRPLPQNPQRQGG